METNLTIILLLAISLLSNFALLCKVLWLQNKIADTKGRMNNCGLDLITGPLEDASREDIDSNLENIFGTKT